MDYRSLIWNLDCSLNSSSCRLQSFVKNSKGMEIFVKSWEPADFGQLHGLIFLCLGYGDSVTFYAEGEEIVILVSLVWKSFIYCLKYDQSACWENLTLTRINSKNCRFSSSTRSSWLRCLRHGLPWLRHVRRTTRIHTQHGQSCGRYHRAVPNNQRFFKCSSHLFSIFLCQLGKFKVLKLNCGKSLHRSGRVEGPPMLCIR